MSGLFCYISSPPTAAPNRAKEGHWYLRKPMKLTWSQPKTYTDGSAFGAGDFAGFEISIDESPAVSIPVQWNDTGKYSFDLATLQLADGQHAAKLRSVAKNGQKSVYSAAAAFTHARIPSAPLDLAAV